jgi:hypothetical protein
MMMHQDHSGVVKKRTVRSLFRTPIHVYTLIDDSRGGMAGLCMSNVNHVCLLRAQRNTSGMPFTIDISVYRFHSSTDGGGFC